MTQLVIYLFSFVAWENFQAFKRHKTRKLNIDFLLKGLSKQKIVLYLKVNQNYN